MTVNRPDLARHWVRSHEEDEAGVQVYRPHNHPLPPARGREGLDLSADGSADLYGSGQTDAALSHTGRWTLSDTDILSVDLAGRDTPWRLQVIDVQPDILRVRGAP